MEWKCAGLQWGTGYNPTGQWLPYSKMKPIPNQLLPQNYFVIVFGSSKYTVAKKTNFHVIAGV